MHPESSKSQKTSNNVEIFDSESNRLEEESEEASLPTSLRKLEIEDYSTCKEKSQKETTFFMNDLVKMVQISLIVALFLFICYISYAIIGEIGEFHSQSEAREVSMINDIKRNEPIIKMQLTQNDIETNKENPENIDEKILSAEQKKVTDSEKELEVTSTTEDVSKNKEITNEDSIKSEDSLSENVDSDRTVELKEVADQKIEVSSTKEKTQNLIEKKKVENNEIIENAESEKNSNAQTSKSEPLPEPTHSEQNSLKAKTTKKSTSISTHTEIPKTELYDPVLIQMDKMRKKSGGNYRDSIYTMRNTQISEEQYKMAKELIEITEFYNAKNNKFDVKHSKISEYKCGGHDPNCEIKQKQINDIVSNEKKYYLHKYKEPWKSIRYELPFCIIVPSYKNNHKNNIFKNLNSIFQQQYTNFHVIYIDDNSKDGTTAKVKGYRTINGIEQYQLTLVVNKENTKALNNIYKAAHYYCKKNEIMLIVDGDDYLIGTQVLKLLNFEYQTKKLLAAYTNYLRINEPYYVKVGTSTPYTKLVMDKRNFRKNYSIFRASHLRSFYVDLFRKIDKSDLQDAEGNFFTAANDFAIMMPILEMAAPHIEYIPELTYLYDSGTGLNNFQSKQGVQTANAKIIAKRKIYPQIDNKEFYGFNF